MPPPPHPLLCRVQDVEGKYYANGEDAYEMRKTFASAKQRPAKGGSSGKAPAVADAPAAGSS